MDCYCASIVEATFLQNILQLFITSNRSNIYYTQVNNTRIRTQPGIRGAQHRLVPLATRHTRCIKANA
jgi:hypothetical protein